MDHHRVIVVEGRSLNSAIFHKGDGYYYSFREMRHSRARLRCRQYKRGCRGTAVINLQDHVLHHLQPHNHERDLLLVEDLQLRKQMIAAAKTCNIGKSVNQHLIEWRTRCQNPNLAMRFTRVRMRSSIYKALRENYPQIPRSLLHLGILLGIPNMRAICRTVDGTDYIFQGMAGNQAAKTLSVVFISGRMIEFLQSRTTIHLDGTFKKRPKKPKCRQIYNLVTRFGNNVVAIMRCLMMRKAQAAYVELFRYLRLIAPNFAPRMIHCDFEIGQINAALQVFPAPCRIVGCLWHYAVACSSYARQLGLGPLARENDLIFTFIRCLCAAPTLPRCLIWQGVLEIWDEVQEADLTEELRPLFNYFETYWLLRLNELSVYGCAERTNNLSEVDNFCLSTVVPNNRPNIWALIGGFIRLEYLSWLDVQAIREGRPVTARRRWKSIFNDSRIKRFSILLEQGDLTPGGFLHRVSWCLMGPVRYGLHVFEDESDSDSGSDSDSD